MLHWKNCIWVGSDYALFKPDLSLSTAHHFLFSILGHFELLDIKTNNMAYKIASWEPDHVASIASFAKEMDKGNCDIRFDKGHLNPKM